MSGDVELLYDALYAEMVTSPVPPVESFAPWPASVRATLNPAADATQLLPIIGGTARPATPVTELPFAITGHAKSLLGNG